MNHTGYVVQKSVYALWDMGGDRRLNGEPFTSHEAVTLRIPIQFHHWHD